MADRSYAATALLDRMAAALAARWRERAAAKVEDSPEGHCADLARVAAETLPGFGTYRTAWEAGHAAGVAESRAPVVEALRDEITDLRQHGDMISAHWVAQRLEHIANYGHRAPQAGERFHVHHEGQADHDRVEADITRRFHLKQAGRSPFSRGDRAGFTAGSGRHYEGERSDHCPGDGVAGHRHDVRCIQSPT